jgi:hypothetical protein
MRRALILLLLLIAPISAQEPKDQENLRTTEVRYPFGKYEIVIRHLERIKFPTQEQIDAGIRPLWFSEFLELWERGKRIGKLDFEDIQPLGSKAGIFLPLKQVSPGHFILTKYGDYDGRTIIITDNGKLFNLGGGTYRIFRHRYLVTPRALPDIDEHGEFSVFDLKENKVLVTPAWRDLTKDSLLRSSSDWIDTIRFYTAGSELFVKIGGIAENSQIQGYINLFFKIDLKTGKLEDAVFDRRKHKEFVIDYSNLDLDHSAIDQHSLDLCHDSRPFVVQ